ncbi:MAG: hypothetical protein JOY95_05870 [Silvibacterium sp.]|nr:hypothetical protein [Silvibacterium sp.]
MQFRASFVVALLGLGLAAVQAPSQTPTRTLVESPHQLVADVMYNELRDRECDSFWQYRSVRVSGSQEVVREQVETGQGPIFRVLEDHNHPLNAQQRQKEEQRLQDLVTRPGAMNSIEQDHLRDEERLKRIIQMLPEAFLYEYDGPAEGDEVRLTYHPNPAYTPSTYEGRVIHALAGTLVVNQRLKRMVAMKGTMLYRVDFGYGLLGYVDKGGTFEIQREQVSETHWKTHLVDVHIQGRVFLLHSVAKDQREERSNFHPVPHDISLAAAKQLLDQVAGSPAMAELTSSKR